MNESNLSMALMLRPDFELLYQRDWLYGAGGSTIYPAKEFINRPPKSTRFYDGGFVFRPSGTVRADQFNLYKGMLIEPDASGSCSLLHELIDQVWADGNAEVAKWVREWLMHILAHPGDKVGTSIAIRGAPGDGKSIVFERLLNMILGGNLLRVANQKMILGDFNEALIGELLVILEEAAFSGDKQAFDQMKELITGETVLINPKHKAPIIVDNYARLVVISNHDHFLHLKPGDRRYTVLESTSAWRGTTKYEALIDQWKNGGAARFLHDALNHKFRRMEGRERLVINTVLKTPATARQMALSRSGLERFAVEFMLNGSLSINLFQGDGTQLNHAWGLDEALEIRSQDIEELARSWLLKYESSSGKHGVTLHTIIGTLKRYIGEIGEIRKKGKGEVTGHRIQLPTIRRLPPRQAAIEHAWANGLITDDEYRASNSVDTKAAGTDPDDQAFEEFQKIAKDVVTWQ